MVLLFDRRKVGSKGQIVIPKAFRKARNIYPGDEVNLELREDGIVIEKQESDPIAVFERIAKSVKSKKRIDWSRVDWHELHEERMREYAKKKGL